MTTTFRNRRPRRSPATLITIAALVVIVGAALLWRTQAAGLLWRALAPALSARDALFATNVSTLEAQLASTTALVADRNLLYQENLDLKARLGRDAALGQSSVLAGVIARPPAVPYDTLMIDAGTKQGVTVGALVSAGGTTLIGTVAEAYPTTARVVLFSAPGETYQGLLMHQGAPPVPLSILGQGGGSLTAQLPAGTAVAAGDAIVFPGIAEGFGGAVSAVSTPPGSSFETIYLTLPVNPLSLRYVEVRLNFHAR